MTTYTIGTHTIKNTQRNTTINEALNIYLRNVEARGSRETTVNTYRFVLEATFKMLKNLYPETDLINDVTPQMMNELYNSDAFSSMSKVQKNYYVAAIQRFFKEAVHMELISGNPAKSLTTVKVQRSDPEDLDEMQRKYYTPEEVKRILAVCNKRNSERQRAIISLMVGAGLRTSEVRWMKVGAWRNMTKNHIYIERKGGSMKWVPIPDSVVRMVQPYVDLRNIDELSDDETLFVSGKGKPMAHANIYEEISARQRLANVAVGLHIFRHTFLTAANNASSLEMAQQLASHSSSKTTQIYVHTTADERLDVVNNTSIADMLSEIK